MNNVIPAMTHPLSRHWQQPDPSLISVGVAYATMDTRCFEALAEYSLTIPSGVYEGKMWKARQFGEWSLCWYGVKDDSDRCSINSRRIQIVEAV